VVRAQQGSVSESQGFTAQDLLLNAMGGAVTVF